MVLPAIQSLADCADFSKTVLPYLPQLYDLPQKLLENYYNFTELQKIYLATNPLITGFAFSLFLVPIFLLVSEINRNYSQVDRAWSILPTVYNAHFVLYAHLAGLRTSGLDNLLAFSAIWSLRLTFNYWRKGGYNIGSEDYRWEIVRSKVPPAVFFIFNIIFISLAQSVLLFSLTMPTYVLLLTAKLGVQSAGVDSFFVRVLLGLVLVEFFADQQQWNFQQAKQQYSKTAKVPRKFEQADLDRGFVIDGLWSYCRHPNFAAEQAIWVTLYVWSCFNADVLYNWTGVGAASLLLLFQGSTWLTELISSQKYPEYKDYQRRVNRFLPTLITELPDDKKENVNFNRVKESAAQASKPTKSRRGGRK